MSFWEGSAAQEVWERQREERDRVARMTPQQKAAHYRVPLLERPEPVVTPDPNPVVAVCWCGVVVHKLDEHEH